MRRFEIVQSDTDTTTSHSGLALVGRALGRTRLGPDLDDNIPLRHGIAHSDCIVSYVGSLCTGKSDFDAVEDRRDDAFFKTSLGIAKVPSAPSLRQRFDEHAISISSVCRGQVRHQRSRPGLRGAGLQHPALDRS